jgi:hypothetical protein
VLTTEEIVQLYEQRRRNQGPVQEQMRRVRDLANGDVIVPLNELDKNAKSSVANLLVQGLDQMSMRVTSTMPSPYFPPIKEGSERSKSSARMRKRAMLFHLGSQPYANEDASSRTAPSRLLPIRGCYQT